MGRTDDKLIAVGHRTVGNLQSIEASLERMLGDMAITDPATRALLVDASSRLHDVWVALSRELDRPRTNWRFLRTLLVGAGLAVAALADVGGAIDTVEEHGPAVAEAAADLAEGLLDLELPGLDPTDLWIPARLVPITAMVRAPWRATVGDDGMTVRPGGRVPEGMVPLTDEHGEVVTEGGQPVYVEGAPSEAAFGTPTVSDADGRSLYQVAPLEDGGGVGAPRLGPLDDDAEGT